MRIFGRAVLLVGGDPHWIFALSGILERSGMHV
jgi:hypothetical protein